MKRIILHIVFFSLWVPNAEAQELMPTQLRYQTANDRFPQASTSMSSMDAAVADLDGDEKPELVLATEFGPNRLFFYQGGRWFEDEERLLPALGEYTAPYLGEDSEDIAVADFDRDGDLDLFFVSEDSKKHELLLNDGKGRFTNATDMLPTDVSTTLDATFVDLNADGYLDLITTNFVNDVKCKVFVHQSAGEGMQFEVNDQLLPELSYFGGTTVLPIDLDEELLLYFANYKSEDILLAPNRQ